LQGLQLFAASQGENQLSTYPYSIDGLTVVEEVKQLWRIVTPGCSRVSKLFKVTEKLLSLQYSTTNIQTTRIYFKK